MITQEQKAARVEALAADLDQVETYVRSIMDALGNGYTAAMKRKLVNLLLELAEEAKAIR